MKWLHRDTGRPLTPGERRLTYGMFGDAIDPELVRLHRSRWWPLQPRNVTMAPDGHIWFHPEGPLWRDDFTHAPLNLQALLIHELTHVWQHQRGINLLLRRHPFCRYVYTLVDGKPLHRYGLEQQAMIAEHAFAARIVSTPLSEHEALLAGAGFQGSATTLYKGL